MENCLSLETSLGLVMRADPAWRGHETRSCSTIGKLLLPWVQLPKDPLHLKKLASSTRKAQISLGDVSNQLNRPPTSHKSRNKRNPGWLPKISAAQVNCQRRPRRQEPQGRFVGKIVVAERENSTSFDCFFMYATEVSHTAGFPWFAAPRVLVLHTLRTFMSTHVLELGRPSVARPVLLVFLDPKIKATNSPENAI